MGAILIMGCANVVPPSGGPTDTNAPKLLSTDPAALSTNVAKDRITFRFDEYVQVKNPSALLVAPPTAEAPTVLVIGRQLQVRFSTPLQPNTTYTIDASGVVADLTESNLAGTAKAVFSTGPTIDSAAISGLVVNITTGDPATAATAALYPSDSALKLGVAPLYAANTDSNGRYELSYVRPGKYKVLVFGDLNKNRIPDAGESFVASPALIELESNKFELPALRLSPPKPLPSAIKDVRAAGPGTTRVTFTTAPRSISLAQGKNGSFDWVPAASTLDSINVITTDLDLDTVQFLLRFDNRDTLISAATRRFIDEKERAGFRNAQTVQILAYPNGIENVLRFRMPAPVLSINESKIAFVSTSGGRKMSSTITKDSVSQVLVAFTPVPGARYTISIADSAVYDMYSRANASFSKEFTVTDVEELGTLQLNVTDSTFSKGFQIEILNSGRSVVRTVALRSNRVLVRGLAPGDYYVRLLIDNNANGIFDGADAQDFSQTDDYRFLPGKVTLRAGWTVEQDITALLKE